MDVARPEESLRQLLVKEKKRKQTERARSAALLAKARKRWSDENEKDTGDAIAAEFANDLQPGGPLTKSGAYDAQHRNKRLRLLWSWLSSTCQAVAAFFSSSGGAVRHCMSIVIFDDTNMRVAETLDACPRWHGARVVTVLQNVQSFVARYDDEAGATQWLTFLLHTPLCCLPRATAPVVARMLVSWLFAFCGIIGSRFQQLGLGAKLLQTIPLQGLILCCDALVTNLALVKLLRVAIYKYHKEQQENICCPLLVVLCHLHQLALLRKTLLCHSPFWGNITRLGHLFESSNFKKQFRQALLSLVSENFSFVAVVAKPPEWQAWHRERVRSCRLFGTSRRSRLHQSLCQMDNGPPSSASFTHYCTGPSCCPGESLEKREEWAALQMLKGYFLLFGLGFAVPLMYRWKHSGEALEYCKEGLMLHEVLPRTLRRMSDADAKPVPGADRFQEVLADAGLLPSEDAEPSFATVNAKRKQMVWEAFQSPDFLQKILVCDSLVRPTVEPMHQLFKRSAQVASLYHLPQDSEERAGLMQESSRLFHLYMSGKAGEDMIQQFVRKLARFEDLGLDLTDAKSIDDFWRLSLLLMTETWRRFCCGRNSFPYCLFQLCSATDVGDLVRQIGALKARAALCERLVDGEFSGPLLAQFATELDEHDPTVQLRAQKLQAFLSDVATFGPLSSDCVECSHGFGQGVAHRFRGLRQSEQVLAETTLWAHITAGYSKLKQFIWRKVGDCQLLNRVKCFGQPSGNQYKKRKDKCPGRRKTIVTAASLRHGGKDEKLRRKKLCGCVTGLVAFHLLLFCLVGLSFRVHFSFLIRFRIRGRQGCARRLRSG